MSETGIVSVIVGGMIVGNMRVRAQRELREFKEQLTVLLIGMLFVLLAADVRLREIAALGMPGLLVVLALMFLVRPAVIVSCTWRAGITWRQKAFLSWVAPRGIVAAAVASLFNEELTAAGIAGGQDMRAMVFLVIAATVLFQGATANVMARLLRVRRPTGQGYAILGANPLARTLGRILKQAGQKVILIDADALAYREAEEEDCRVVYGNGLEERVLLGAGMESRKAVIGTLPNGAVNLLFASKARKEFKVPRAYVAIQRGHGSIDAEMVHEAGASILFGEEVDLELWSVRVRRGMTDIQLWTRKQQDNADQGEEKQQTEDRKHITPPREMRSHLLPLAVRRGEDVKPFDDQSGIRADDEVLWLVLSDRSEAAGRWLAEQDWVPSATPKPEPQS
jgi:hypothetical protein